MFCRTASSEAKFRSQNFDSKFALGGPLKIVLNIAYLKFCAVKGGEGGYSRAARSEAKFRRQNFDSKFAFAGGP